MPIKRPESSHDCMDGTTDEDHDFQVKQDTDGDGIYTQTYTWLECRYCGKKKDYDESYDDDPWDAF